MNKGNFLSDSKGLIFEAYNIEDISEPECRSIFLDWALSLDSKFDPMEEIRSYLKYYREITEGSIYHVIFYGRNAMGSHASQVNEEERWQITQYVMELRSKLK